MGGNFGNRKHRGNHRNNFRGGRGRGGRGNRNGSGGNRDNSKSQWQTKERLTEPEVGITQYISDLKGFHGIIKSRF